LDLLQIIDISSVSSIIFKYKDEYLIFKQLDIWYAKTHESINPFLSFMWNKYDLFFIIIWILFSEEKKSVNKKIPIEHENFKKFSAIVLAALSSRGIFSKFQLKTENT
jgi:hypothetical protein